MAVRKRDNENRGNHYRELFRNFSLIIGNLVSQGFDEFMNLVMDDAVELYIKKDFRRQIGRFEFENLVTR